MARKRVGVDGNLDFRAPANEAFLEDLAACRALFSTAGNQLVGEAIHLGKPILLVPEDTAEQRLNARAAAEMGVGRWIRPGALTAATVRAFLANLQRHQAALARAGRAGDAGALELLHCLARELAVLHRPSLTVASRPCW